MLFAFVSRACPSNIGTYAEAIAKYGLQRGIDGSEAKYISTQQYYREVFVQKNEIAEQIENLKGQQERYR